MANNKIYTIQINGITESIDAVKALEKELFNLEERIKALEAKSVNIKAGSSGSGGSTRTSNVSSLSEEEQIQREINKLKAEGEKLDAKIAATQDEIYKRVDATKQLYKETVADQKALAAAERLQADAYSNTMQGMKNHLADLKAVINTTDLGDGDKIKEMTEEANKLTNKLKEMEEAYGQFGRNVGNYPDAAKSLQSIVVTIGGVEREFGSAREATKTLNNELKAMAVQGKQNTKEYEELRQKILELESTLNDAKKPMDGLMDTMESITAIASVSKGFGAFFGVDTTEIQKSMQQLLALQTALKGLQTISKQIETREGIGAWIAPFNVGIDKATAKLLTFNTALLGTGKAAKTASIAIKGFSKALKVAFSAGVLIVVDLLIEGVMKLVESFKKVDEAAEREKAVQKDLAEAYGNAQSKLIQYKTKVDEFNGSKKEEKKLVAELNKEFGETLGTYNSLAKWQDVLKKKGDAYIQTLINQAKAQAALNEVAAAYMNLEDVKQKRANGDYSHWYQSQQQDLEAGARAIESANQRIAKAEENLRKIVTENDKYAKDNKLGNYAPQIEKNTDKTKKALEEQQRTINQLQVRLMADGLNKKLRQLDEEERQTIQKLKENGRKSFDAIKKIESSYAQLRTKEIQEYLKTVEGSVRKTAIELTNIQFSLDLKDIDNEIERLQNKFDELGNKVPKNKSLISSFDFNNILGNTSKIDYLVARQYSSDKARALTGQYDNYYRDLYSYISNKNEEIRKKFNEIYDLTEGSDTDKKKTQYGYAAKLFEEEYKDALNIVRDYGSLITDYFEVASNDQTKILENGFEARLNASKKYYNESITQLVENLKKQSELKEQAIKKQAQKEYDAERDRYRNQYNSLSGQASTLESDISGFSPRNSDDEAKLKKMKESLDEIYAQMETAANQHATKMAQINDIETNAIKKNTLDTYNDISSQEEKYFNTRLSDYRDFQSKLNDEISRNPVTDKAGFGIVNITQTRNNYKEILNASKATLNGIQDDKNTLDKLYKGGFIKEEAYNATLKQLNELEQGVKNGMSITVQASNNIVGDFIQSINQYIQAVMDSFSTIMNAVWAAQDVANDKEAEALDKQNKIIQDKLDKQKDIIEKHKSSIDSIEDELSTARGDRRQHLIDQLNAEMAAQREAQAQEKKIQKEKEANERKQEELEKKRKKQQYQRDMIQAIVNGAMAVTFAAANAWPIPAIPMMALAASTTAAQIAIMAANKPYAKGGLLEGPSHAQGGIPVGNTGIEVEGKEYVIRKSSTAPNIEILDYINKSERKLDLDDFIEFYSSGKVRKTITSMSPRSRFADGGTIPTLNTNIDINDRLLSAFEDYSNRPVYVSVQDINSRQKAVKDVQVLAGLTE